jgi:hypothetical protein
MASEHLNSVLQHAEAAALIPVAYYQPHPLDNDVHEAIVAAMDDLVPAGREAAFEGVIFAARVLGIKRPPNDVLSGYAAILGELPLDLLRQALRDGLAEQTYHVLPTPGLFMTKVKHELEARRSRLSLLKRHRERVRLADRTRPTDRSKLEAVTYRPVPTRLRRIDPE